MSVPSQDGLLVALAGAATGIVALAVVRFLCMPSLPAVSNSLSLPPVGPSYLRAIWALLTKPRTLPGEAQHLPDLQANVHGPVSIQLDHLERYRKICRSLSGQPGNILSDGNILRGMQGDTLPPAYLNAVTFRLQLYLMTHPRFPLSPIGAVHARNQIHQIRPLKSTEVFSFEATLLPTLTKSEKGTNEFDIVVEAFSSEKEMVWRNVATFALPKTRSSSKSKPISGAKGANIWPTEGPKKPKEAPKVPKEGQILNETAFGTSDPRAYSALNGDINPIHMHPLSARLFGYRSVLCHGMHAAAWATDNILRQMNTTSVQPIDLTVEVRFLRPMVLPAQIRCCQLAGDTWQPAGAIDGRSRAGFQVSDVKGD
eukprot:CAMPEP_0198208810 /NCGR_PEP_ID=MMETSP1445-20131203/12145_1 /TAXON_ID=36898 /ORGANISM="Pyramimonas sp., Strain CCMP2087" /LENGTH=369 /DNA_ID=CAMNT_0043882353 /DNA_START=179 /DNA_END=1285 /DNA_ORIENTATION=+